MPTHSRTQPGGAVGEGCGQLLPGIPNEITIDQIAPKLPWTAFHILSSVSRDWQKAIQGRLVYDARVRFHATETFVVFGYSNRNFVRRILLYSMKDDCCYHLPPIPQVDFGNRPVLRTLAWSKCICLDGRVYALGVSECVLPDENRVYVFDMAGERRWKQCASMPDLREGFGCGVGGGKIYVFEGKICGYRKRRYHFCGSLVYDPKEDFWSPIKPMRNLRVNPKVITLRDEFFVYGGQVYDAEVFGSDVLPADIYHPLENEWRIVEQFSGDELHEVMLTMRENIHKLTRDRLYVFNTETNLWSFVQSLSCNPRNAIGILDAVGVGDVDPIGVLDAVVDDEDEDELVGYFDVEEDRDGTPIGVLDAVAVDDELLGVFRRYRIDQIRPEICFMRTRLVGEDNERDWQPSQCSLSVDDHATISMCLIQL